MADSPETLPSAWIDEESGTTTDTARLLSVAGPLGDWLDSDALTLGLPTAKDIDAMLPKDGKARNVEQVLTLPLRLASYSIEPGKGDSGQAEKITELLTRPGEMGGMRTPLGRLIAQMTAAVGYRRAYFERVWTVTDDGLNGYKDVGWRPATSCRPVRDDTGNLNGFQQWVRKGTKPGEWVTIEAGRSFIYTHGQHRNPVNGVSDLDVTWTVYKTKQKIRFLWLLFAETSALPKMIGKVSSSKNDDNAAKQALARQLASLKNGGAVAIGADEDVTEVQAGTGAAFTALMAYLDHEMVDSVLAGFMEMTGSTRSNGSRAMSSTFADLYMQSRTAVLSEMADEITHGLIADLVRYNFGSAASCPRLKFGSLTNEDTEATLDLLKTMLGTDKGAQLLPEEFVSELLIRVGGLLNLDVDKLSVAVKKAQADAEQASALGASQVGQLAAAIGTTAGIAQKVAGPPTPPIPAAA
jgi:hypothetical protein